MCLKGLEATWTHGPSDWLDGNSQSAVTRQGATGTPQSTVPSESVHRLELRGCARCTVGAQRKDLHGGAGE